MNFVTADNRCRTEVNIPGMALKGFVFKKMAVTAPHKCDVRCEREITCQSYNFVIAEKSCELNNRTKEARPENFHSDKARFYIRRLNGRAPLGSIPELPAQSCHEIKASEGKDASSNKYWLDPTLTGVAVLVYCDMNLKDIDECSSGSHKCDMNAKCNNTVGSYNCTCKEGYTGDGRSCSDIDECSDGSHKCDRNANCTNNVGSFYCTCKEGYTGDGSWCAVDLKTALLMADVVIWGTKDFQVPKYFNFADVIDEWAQNEKQGTRKSNHPALWWVDGVGNEVKWSFQDVAIKSKKTASILSRAADIKPGDHVMVILPTIPEYWLIQAACLRTVLTNSPAEMSKKKQRCTAFPFRQGGVLIITPVNIGPKELHRRILKSKPVCVVAAPCDQIKSELIDIVNQITSSGQVEVRSRIVINRIKDEKWEGWLSFEDLFETASADFQSVKSLSSAPTNIFFTSGTSGNAKMVEHCHASMGLGSTGMRQYVK
ncbi:hypothetical protein ACROYT_G015958 [Oculina patagonica]